MRCPKCHFDNPEEKSNIFFHSDAAAFYSTKQRRLTFLRLGSPFQAGALAALSGRRSRVPELGSFLDGWLLLCQESIALDIRNGLHSTG
jgi:hypothetical protein